MAIFIFSLVLIVVIVVSLLIVATFETMNCFHETE